MPTATRRPPAILGLFAAVFVLAATNTAMADGYNDWPGELVPAGEVDAVPSVQIALQPKFSSYVQLQFEIGLPRGIELSLTGAFYTTTDGVIGDGIWLQPRLALTDLLSVTLGAYLPSDSDQNQAAAIAAVTHTVRLKPERWKLNWNLFATSAFANLQDPELYAVATVERRFSETLGAYPLGVYAECDVTFTPQSTAPPMVQAFAGFELIVDDDDTFNFSLMLPLRPSLEPGQIAFGVWYSRRLRAAHPDMPNQARTGMPVSRRRSSFASTSSL